MEKDLEKTSKQELDTQINNMAEFNIVSDWCQFFELLIPVYKQLADEKQQ